MEVPLLLYSVNTLLAFRINQRYYGEQHYVWCAPVFDGSKLPPTHPYFVPPTSSPAEIFCGLREEVYRADGKSSKVKDNKAGIIRGASEKRKARIINRDQEEEIRLAVLSADLVLFRPLLYVIPYKSAARFVSHPRTDRKANRLSDEFVIESLHRKLFDVIEEPSRT